MAPLRRYLRITKHSVLEVRIFLEDPAHVDTWLLRKGGGDGDDSNSGAGKTTALARVIEAVRPLVLPKLREENMRARGGRSGDGGGGGKSGKKGVKDVVSRDEFDVSIFLTENSTRHSLLIKSKDFKTKKKRIRSNSGKLTGQLGDKDAAKDNGKDEGEGDESPAKDPITLSDNEADDGEADKPVTILQEDEDDNDNGASGMKLADIPEIPADHQAKSTGDNSTRTRQRRQRTRAGKTKETAQDVDGSSDDNEGDNYNEINHSSKNGAILPHTTGMDNKKKMLLQTTYDGFSIYGRILCLIVNYKKAPPRRGNANVNANSSSPGSTAAGKKAGQQMLEQWVSSQAVLNEGGGDSRDD